jgi:DNA repair protein RecN (Recombination protein N)
MLRDLSIRNLAIVEDLRLELARGFTAVTGETGAGKSILVDALMLAAGGRASADMLRHEADRLVVSARFDGVEGILRGRRGRNHLGRREIVIRREIGDGRGRAFINDEAVAARTCGWASASSRSTAREGAAAAGVGDRGGAGRRVRRRLVADAEKVAGLAREFREAERRKEELASSRRDRDRRLDLLRFEVAEIDAAALGDVDEDALASERNLLAHADKVRHLGESAASALSEDEGSAADRLGEASRAIAELARIDGSFAEAESEIAELKARAADLAGTVARRASAVEADPERLGELEDRLVKFARLKKKYGATVAEITAYRDRAAADRDAPGASTTPWETSRSAAPRSLVSYDRAARGALRAAPRGGGAVRRRRPKELAELAMERRNSGLTSPRKRNASRRADGARGDPLREPGRPARSLKIASGGELSRVQLAIESVMPRVGAPRRGGRTLVFGRGGCRNRREDRRGGGPQARVASREATRVLCVTHVPQIAARADRHLRAVSASPEAGRARESRNSRACEGSRRSRECSPGESVTPTARAHAKALLAAR